MYKYVFPIVYNIVSLYYNHWFDENCVSLR